MNQALDANDTANAERVKTVMSALSQGLSGEVPLNDIQLREVYRALTDLESSGAITPVEKGAMWKAVSWSDDIAPFITNKDSSQAELYRTAILDELQQIQSPALISLPHFPGAKKTLQDYIPKLIEPVAEERFRDAQAGFADALGAIKKGNLSGADARRDQVGAALDDSLRYAGGEQGYVKMVLAAATLASDPSKGNEAYYAYAHLIGLQQGIDDHDAKNPGKRLLTPQNRELLESVEKDIAKRLNITMVGNSIRLPDGSLLPVGSEKMSINPVDGTYGFSSKAMKPYETLLSEMEYLRDSFSQRGNVSLGAGSLPRYAALEIINKIDELQKAVKEGNTDQAAKFVKENGLQKWKDNPGSLREHSDKLTALDEMHNRLFKNAHAFMEATGIKPLVVAAKIMDNVIQGQRKGLSDGEITKNIAIDVVSELGLKKLTGIAGTMSGKAVAEFVRNVATDFSKDLTVEGMSKALGNSFYKAVTSTITKDTLKMMSPEQGQQLREFLVDAASKVGAVELVKPYLERLFPRVAPGTPSDVQKSVVTGETPNPVIRNAPFNASSPDAFADARPQSPTNLQDNAQYKMLNDAIETSGVLNRSPLADSKQNLTAALALAATQSKLDSIDSIMINKEGTRLIAIQGDERSEFCKTASVVIQDAMTQPANQSLARTAEVQAANYAATVQLQDNSATIAAKPQQSESGGPRIS